MSRALSSTSRPVRYATMKLEGVHHVTCITGDAPGNVEYYTGTLGLRLVKKSVNQDDPTVYHLFYADEKGSPGSDITFFEYPNASPGRAGAGMVHRVVWRVASTDALDFWEQRVGGERGDGFLRFADPEGLEHELAVVETEDAPLVADHPEIPKELALQGFDGVRAFSDRPGGESRRARGDARVRAGRERHVGGSRRGARRLLRLRPRARRARDVRAPARCTTSPGRRRWTTTSEWQQRVARGGLTAHARSSTASGSAPSTSGSRAACSSRSRPSARASTSTRIRSTSARRLCCRPTSSTSATSSSRCSRRFLALAGRWYPSSRARLDRTRRDRHPARRGAARIRPEAAAGDGTLDRQGHARVQELADHDRRRRSS